MQSLRKIFFLFAICTFTFTSVYARVSYHESPYFAESRPSGALYAPSHIAYPTLGFSVYEEKTEENFWKPPEKRDPQNKTEVTFITWMPVMNDNAYNVTLSGRTNIHLGYSFEIFGMFPILENYPVVLSTGVILPFGSSVNIVQEYSATEPHYPIDSYKFSNFEYYVGGAFQPIYRRLSIGVGLTFRKGLTTGTIEFKDPPNTALSSPESTYSTSEELVNDINVSLTYNWVINPLSSLYITSGMSTSSQSEVAFVVREKVSNSVTSKRILNILSNYKPTRYFGSVGFETLHRYFIECKASYNQWSDYKKSSYAQVYDNNLFSLANTLDLSLTAGYKIENVGIIYQLTPAISVGYRQNPFNSVGENVYYLGNDKIIGGVHLSSLFTPRDNIIGKEVKVEASYYLEYRQPTAKTLATFSGMDHIIKINAIFSSTPYI